MSELTRSCAIPQAFGNHWSATQVECASGNSDIEVRVCILTEYCLFSPRDEWEWLQSLSGPVEVEGAEQTTDCLLYSELQMAIKSLLHQINLPLHQVLLAAGHRPLHYRTMEKEQAEPVYTQLETCNPSKELCVSRRYYTTLSLRETRDGLPFEQKNVNLNSTEFRCLMLSIVHFIYLCL